MAGKRTSTRIPLLKSDGYRSVYFKHPPVLEPLASPAASLQHFEIHNRCIWKNTAAAHRLDFYLVFLVIAGEGTHRMGLHEHDLHKNMLCFVGPNVISSWDWTGNDHRGYFCSFSDDFFNTGRNDKQFLSQLPFFQIDGHAVLELSDEQTSQYATLFQFMENEYAQRGAYSDEVLRSCLHALVYKAHSEYPPQRSTQAPGDRSGLRLLQAFTELYSRDFEPIQQGKIIRVRKVSDYAEALGVSQNHLNDTVRALTGHSAGQLVRIRLVKQATMCLMHSSKTVSEIAYLLGYEDPSYFARFYKSQTGKAPSEVVKNA
ncbi:helix-turn-helix domain-containing protein [Chryseolinea soli]|uniref:Helix-turn-helix domain-containing protein n=1 Tax=Chryseolinea soli TaxID=2321403 RepID=A0A385T1X2_9BACT|nr:AraC family transcriptional regulator [Chryseolinea soli]AYB35128.1 helix-turn-helix domain-containing protein [Chryseolinea soli]